jgi:hypothetical protein
MNEKYRPNCAEEKFQLETVWVEEFNFGNGKVRIFEANGGIEGFLRTRKTIIDTEVSEIEVEVSQPGEVYEYPESITVKPKDQIDKEIRYTFGQTNFDRKHLQRYSIISPDGTIMQGGAGKFHDLSLAVGLLGKGVQEEIESRTVYRKKDAFQFTQEALDAINNA